MHCTKCGSKDTETVRCANCKQNSSIKCKACGHQYCSDRYCEVIALHAKRKQLTQIAIVLFALILCTVPSTYAVMTNAVKKAAVGEQAAAPPPPQQPPAPAQPPAPGGQPPAPGAQPPAPPASAQPPPAPPTQQTAAVPPPAPSGTQPPAPPQPGPPSVPPPPAGGEAPPPGLPPPPDPNAPAPAVPPPAPVPAPAAPDQQQTAISTAIEESLGTAYKRDGSSPEEGGVDAPGYVQWIYRKIGRPEVTRDYGVLSTIGTAVADTNFKPGDILLYSIKKDGNVSFAGLYWKDGKMVYPFAKERRVVEGDMNGAFFKERFVGARRVIQ